MQALNPHTFRHEEIRYACHRRPSQLERDRHSPSTPRYQFALPTRIINARSDYLKLGHTALGTEDSPKDEHKLELLSADALPS